LGLRLDESLFFSGIFGYNEMAMKRYLSGILMCLVLIAGCDMEQHIAEVSSNGDTFGPYINIRMFEYTTVVGQPVDFSNVTGYDDVDGLMPVEVEGSINYDVPGDYVLTLVCSDTSGNESRVNVTVHVIAALAPDEISFPVNTPEATEDTESGGCSAWNAQDPELPCNAVLAETAEKYDRLYQGETWHDICINAAAEDGACEVITANDGSFWGYGVILHAEQEEDEVKEENN